MDAEFESILDRWADYQGDDPQALNNKAHAEFRLAMGDDVPAWFEPPFADDVPGPDDEPETFAATVQRRKVSPAMKDRIDTCLYRGCNTGCQLSVCHAGKGDAWNQVYPYQCAECLTGADARTPTSVAARK